jgi:hypothetical protein
VEYTFVWECSRTTAFGIIQIKRKQILQSVEERVNDAAAGCKGINLDEWNIDFDVDWKHRRGFPGIGKDHDKFFQS